MTEALTWRAEMTSRPRYGRSYPRLTRAQLSQIDAAVAKLDKSIAPDCRSDIYAATIERWRKLCADVTKALHTHTGSITEFENEAWRIFAEMRHAREAMGR